VGQYPKILANCAPINVSKQHPDVNLELLLMSGLNCTMWAYMAPNVPVVEILYAVPCQACFVSEEHSAAEKQPDLRVCTHPNCT
jgi:hypothetical protein